LACILTKRPICTHAIHLVDECQTRHTVAFHLPIHCDGLGLHARHGTQHHHCPIQYPQGTLYFNGEINMDWCIN
jgi:hypothetical protein